MLTEIGSIDNVAAFIEAVKEGKGRLQGFGHRVYKNYDPRATIIKKTADEVFEVTGKNPLLDIALKLEEVALNDDYFISRKLYPNVDFYSGLIYQAMGFPIEMFTVLFAIPRTAGWLAHWVELLDAGPEDRAAPPALHRATAARLRARSTRGNSRLAADVEDDLADVRVRLHVAVRVDHVFEREAPVDHRLQQALVEQRHHLAAEPSADRRLLLERARPQHRADQPRPLVRASSRGRTTPCRPPSHRPARSCPAWRARRGCARGTHRR